MNICVLMGRLTRDPEMRYAQKGETAIGRFSIAVDRRFKREGQPDADFFDCVCFGRQAEFMEKYLRKGIKVVINGSIQNNNYQDRNGQMVYRQQIVCDNIEFAESKSASANSGAGAANQQAAGGQQRTTAAGGGQQGGARKGNANNGGYQQAQLPVDSDGFMNIPDGIDEELPFS